MLWQRYLSETKVTSQERWQWIFFSEYFQVSLKSQQKPNTWLDSNIQYTTNWLIYRVLSICLDNLSSTTHGSKFSSCNSITWFNRISSHHINGKYQTVQEKWDNIEVSIDHNDKGQIKRSSYKLKGDNFCFHFFMYFVFVKLLLIT